ncbi:MAG: FAD-binding oxidoreductase [Candidatus Marinimicrobia bacterium]|nr:FAD-binding oxidoreductase [Candidatus Neomarinimicrobiota bacterium]
MITPIHSKRYSTKLVDRLVYAHDASLYRLIPKAVARPKNEEEVQTLLKYAHDSNTSLTFRTGGTSLSGQAVTDGIIVEVIRDWKDYEIHENGFSITVEPGLTGEFVNNVLQKYQRRLGPDPASIKAARIGGIFSNNASGMCCGVTHNTYHTIKDVRFILGNGHTYDTSNKEDYDRFIQDESDLVVGLKSIKNRIQNSEEFSQKIRDKYRQKNTLGYGLNSFLDFDHPLDIFTHLLVGAEGTLGFVSKVTYNTIPDPGKKATALLLFDSVRDACRIIPDLTQKGADAVELMDFASLTTAKYLSNPPYKVEDLKSDSAALLVEFQRDSDEELTKLTSDVERELSKYNASCPDGFQTSNDIRQKLWQIRKSLYPTVGSLRKKGTSVITEDICFQVDQLPDVINDLQALFQKWHYNDGVVFGHAKDGNLHFVASIDLETQDGINHYEGFIDDLVTMTSGKYNGALKAEHGTGRNMAPFVETEWGGELAELMWEIKSLSDPNNILNPGVLLTKDKNAHVSSLKPMPVVDETIDSCVECGFCEPVCPSRELTLTPRHRIALAREMALMKKSGDPQLKILEKEWAYQFSATCAVDGLCETACPVNINTGQFVKDFRYTTHSTFSHTIAGWTVAHFPFVQSFLRFFVYIIHWKSKIIGHGFFTGFTKLVKNSFHVNIPIWTKYIPNTSKVSHPDKRISKPDFLYFPSCISRVFSAGENRQSLQEIILNISRITDKQMAIPDSIQSLCCGTPYQSKGYDSAYEIILERTVNELYVQTDGGSIPIVVDTSPCSFQFISAGKGLKPEILEKWKKLTFIDLIPFLYELTKDIDRPALAETIVLHATCSTRKMDDTAKMVSLAKKCASDVIIPNQMECCGFAGDRGLLVPELTQSSVKLEQDTTPDSPAKSGYSSSRMCEVGMSQGTEQNYESIALLVNKYLEA